MSSGLVFKRGSYDCARLDMSRKAGVYELQVSSLPSAKECHIANSTRHSHAQPEQSGYICSLQRFLLSLLPKNHGHAYYKGRTMKRTL